MSLLERDTFKEVFNDVAEQRAEYGVIAIENSIAGSILENYDLDTPFFLSGGIDEGDIQAIRKLNHPKLYAVDINSRFEINPGLKNKEKIKRFKQHLMQEV